MPLTDTKIKTIKPLARPVKLSDGGGLFLLVTPNGTKARKNLAALQIGRELIREGETWFVVIPGPDAKTKAPIEFEVPAVLLEYLTIYLDIIRARMLRRANCSALWVSSKGGPLSYSAVWGAITRHTANRLGIHVTPHDGRDAAATTWAIAAPEKVDVARDLLGHKFFCNITTHYELYTLTQHSGLPI